MIVPNFRITQDADFVHVHINVPYVRVSSAEMVCDGHDFSFWCKPYLLKLKFPHELDGSDEERCKATYDPLQAHGTLVAHLPKVEPGQHFPDLDLTTKLLQMRLRTGQASMTSSLAAGMNALPVRHDGPPRISVLSSRSAGSGQEDEDEDEDDLKIEFETEEDISLKVGTHVFYGFNRKYTQVLGRFREEFVDVLELPEADSTPEEQRRTLRLAAENALFSPDRYLGDSMGAAEDPLFEAAISFEPFWTRQWSYWRAVVTDAKTLQVAAASAVADAQDPAIAAYSPQSPEAVLEATFLHADGAGGFTDEERTTLAQSLANRELLVSATEQRALLLGMVDLLYAFCFDHRCTQGEPTVESAHNMTRISASMSWLEQYNHRGDGVEVVICSLMRRVCIYPYLRNWKLGRKVLGDVARVLYLGRHSVLKCLLGLRAVMEHTDTHYMLNKVLLDDYCTWVQSASLKAATLASFAEEFNTTKTAFEKGPSSGKAAVGLQLVELDVWVEQDAFDDQGNEQEIPASFNASNRNAATANTVLSPPILQPHESLLNITKPVGVPVHATLSSMLSGMTVEQPATAAPPSVIAPAKTKPLIQEL